MDEKYKFDAALKSYPILILRTTQTFERSFFFIIFVFLFLVSTNPNRQLLLTYFLLKYTYCRSNSKERELPI
jgi:hypothetical protein